MSNKSEQLWQQLIKTSPQESPKLFLEYCASLIEDKQKDGLSIEQAASKICGITVHNIVDNKQIQDIVNVACELEIPREMSIGAGISIGDKWDAEKAHNYKEEGWKQLVRIIKDAREEYMK